MTGRVLEVSGQSRKIGLHRGFVTISDADGELGRLDLDGLNVILVSSQGAAFTTPLVCEAAARDISIIICNERYQPTAVMLPVIQHSDQRRRFEAQAKMPKGLRNKLWQRIVKAKVGNQACLLERHGSASAQRLFRLQAGVRSGDPENVEAQAAQVYWTGLFGKDFRRNRNLEGVNSLLNYGYAIIRSSMLSAILGAGLHPTFGIFHSNKRNALCLVDDLMEPYRPIIDQIVKRLVEQQRVSLTSDVKAALASIVTSDQATMNGASPLFTHMVGLSQSVVAAVLENKVSLPVPALLTELEIEAVVRECSAATG